MILQLCSEGFALIGPFEGFSHGPIVVFNKSQHFSFEMIQGGEVTPFQ